MSSAFVDEDRKLRIGAFGLLLLVYVAFVYRFWFLTDDAFISFRYARNLAMGNGLRWNLGEPVPVEGYSNFLWVLIAAVFEFFHLDVAFFVPLVSVSCGTLLLFLLFDRLLRRFELGLLPAFLATLSLAAYPPFAVWSSSGLETMPFALAVFVCLDRLILSRGGVDVVGGAAAAWCLLLIRTDGFAWVALLLALALLSRWWAGEFQSERFVRLLLLVGAGAAVYFGWRYQYYGQVVANTTLVKSGLPARYLWRGFDYLVVQYLTFLTPFLTFVSSAFALRKTRRAVGLAVVSLAWAFPAYAIVVTGDFMAMGRFLIPGLAPAAILLAWMLDDIARSARAGRDFAVAGAACILVMGSLPGWDRHLVPESIRARFHFRHDSPDYKSEYAQWDLQRRNAVSWSLYGRALKAYVAERGLRDPSVVKGAIGAVGYYSGMTLYDINGLVSSEVARVPFTDRRAMKSPGHDRTVEPIFFLERAPALLDSQLWASDDPKQIASRLAGYGRDLRHRWPELALDRQYVPDLVRLDVLDPEGSALYLMLWRRLQSGEQPQAAWARFDDLLRHFEILGEAPRLVVPRE